MSLNFKKKTHTMWIHTNQSTQTPKTFFFHTTSMSHILSTLSQGASSMIKPNGITLVTIQDPGETNHPQEPAQSQAYTHARLIVGYQHEVHFYEGTESAEYASARVYQKLYPATHGMFEACHRAWAHHASLVLSPDDVWLSIQAVFAAYMRVNAEALRSTFVSHDGSKELVIHMDDAPNDWKLFISRVVGRVTESSKVNMAATFVPPFSSSTALDTAMKSLAVMDHMQSYFSYTFSTMCGVRNVGLRGTLEDWTMLRAYVDGLRAFAVPPEADMYFTDPTRSFASWLDDVTNIVDNLIATFQNKPDVAWWNAMIGERRTHGSGASTYIKGWIIALVSKNPITIEMKLSEVKSLRFSVPVKRDENGIITKLRVMGGFTGAIHTSPSNSWEPQRSIAVLDDVSATTDDDDDMPVAATAVAASSVTEKSK